MDHTSSRLSRSAHLAACLAASALVAVGGRASAQDGPSANVATMGRDGTGNTPAPAAADLRDDPTLQTIRTAPPDASDRIVAAVDDRVLANDRAMHAARQRIQSADADTAARFHGVAATVREAERRLHRSLQAVEATMSPADWGQRRRELADNFAAYTRAFRTAQQIAGIAPDAMTAKTASE